MKAVLSTSPGLVDEEFGALLARYSQPSSKGSLWVCLSIIGVIIIIVFVFAAKGEHVEPGTFLILVAPFALAAVFFQAVAYLPRREVLVFEDALVDMRGKKCEACRWDKVEAVYQTLVRMRSSIFLLPIYERLAQSYTVRRADGRTFLFEQDIGHVEELFAWICYKTLPPLLTWALVVLDAGDDVKFEMIRFNHKGLGGATWERLRGMNIWVENGCLKIGTKGTGWFSGPTGVLLNYPIERIPNVHLLLTLVERHIPLPPSLRAAFIPEYQASIDSEKLEKEDSASGADSFQERPGTSGPK